MFQALDSIIKIEENEEELQINTSPIKKEEDSNASIILLNGLSTKPKGKKRKHATAEDDEHKQKLLKKEEVCSTDLLNILVF